MHSLLSFSSSYHSYTGRFQTVATSCLTRLDERVPALQAWHVKLGSTESDDTGGWNSVLESKTEISVKQGQKRPHVSAEEEATGVKRIRTKQIGRRFSGKAPRKILTSTNANKIEEEDEEEEDSATMTLPPALGHESSVRQDYGLTTTYELPGQRTLIPSSVPRRHILAELDLATVTLSHVLIPKLRPAAFLTAKMQNTFLGTVPFAACAPGNVCNLSLSVDPSILVAYGPPTVRRATAGLLTKEDSAVFTRACWIKNTKTTAVSISAMDQVPVSQDEKLRVNILEPKGLEQEGDQTHLDGQWGEGVASFEKDGEVKWQISQLGGKEVRLVLEYETRLPRGHRIIEN
ncbi:hypothetical protein VTN96DRAFT_3265 [Rasamsonia emersonii]